MAKKVALFISLVLVFSLSLVFATEGTQDTLLIAPAPSGEITDTITTTESGESPISGEISTVSGETIDNVSGESEITSGENVSDETLNTETTDDTTAPTTDPEETETESNNTQSSTVVGAIIAIVIVIAVVAIVAVIQKK